MTNTFRAPTLAALTLLAATGTVVADPPGPVTACASDTQSGSGLNLAQALSFGGIIRFNCPAGTSIRVTGRYVVRVSTMIDGGDTVTLDGHGAIGPMLNASANVILRRLTVRSFVQGPIPSLGKRRGSVLATSGDAELDRVTIENSDFPIDIGGAGTVRHSTFFGNRVDGLSIAVGGIAHIERSRFTGSGTALSITAGWVRSCQFNGQTRNGVSVHRASGDLEIRHSTFSGIRGGSGLRLAQHSAGNGPHTISVRANVFQDNDGGASAGAITVYDDVREARDRGQPESALKILAALPPARYVLAYNRFVGNRGANGGAIAANLAHTRGMISTGDLFVGNAAAGEGGAVSISGGALQMSHALFKSNRAGGRGAAIFVAVDGSAVLSNALVVENTGPAGAIAGNTIGLANVTAANNAAAGLLLESPAARVSNVLLAGNRPADCLRVPAGVFRGGGLQSDGSCPGVATGDAFLDSFYVPAAGSPALQAGDTAICQGTLVGGVDFPFQRRLKAATCSLGAFERPPVRKLATRSDRAAVHADKQDDFSDADGYRPAPPAPSVTGGPK